MALPTVVRTIPGDLSDPHRLLLSSLDGQNAIGSASDGRTRHPRENPDYQPSQSATLNRLRQSRAASTARRPHRVWSAVRNPGRFAIFKYIDRNRSYRVAVGVPAQRTRGESACRYAAAAGRSPSTSRTDARCSVSTSR
jgi:hypothetical protein